MGIVERAIMNFKVKKFNCCQAVICAYCEEYGISDLAIFKLAEGFGFGMGMQDVCGAVTGMFMAISMHHSVGDKESPAKTKQETYAHIRAAAEAFREKNGSIYCRDLKSVKDGKQLVSCEACVRAAAEYVEAYIKGE